MNNVVANTLGDVDLWAFGNAVIDKVVELIKTKYDKLELQYLDIAAKGNEVVPCWTMPVALSIKGKKVSFTLVFARSNNHTHAMHIVRRSSKDSIALYILSRVDTWNPPPQKSLLKFLELNLQFRRYVLHELVHYFISRRFKSKSDYIDYATRTNFDTKAAKRKKNAYKSYYNEPTEMNTHYFEIVQEVMYVKNQGDAKEKSKVFKTFEAFLKFADKVHNGDFFTDLTEANKKRLLKRLYGLWEALKATPTAKLVKASERMRRRVGILVTETTDTGEGGLEMRTIASTLASRDIPYVLIAAGDTAGKRGRKPSSVSGFEIFDKVTINKNTRSTPGKLFQTLCEDIGVSTQTHLLTDTAIYGQFKYQFKSRTGVVEIWTQHHPMYDNGPAIPVGFVGDLALKVEPSSAIKFGVIRSKLRSITDDVPPKFTRITKEDIHSEFMKLLNELLNEKNK